MWFRRASSITIGLDIGRSAVRALALDYAGGLPEVIACHEERWGEERIIDDDATRTPQTLPGATARTVDQLRRILPINRAHVVTAIHGRGVVVKPLEVEPVAPHQVREVLRWEADEHLPFPAEDTVFDHVLLPARCAGEMRVLLVAVHRPLLMERVNLLRAAGITRAAITIDVLATCNACRFHDPDSAIGRTALVTVARSQLQTVLLNDGVPSAVWETERAASLHAAHAVSETISRGLQRCEELEQDRQVAALPTPLRGAWVSGEAASHHELLNTLGEQLRCPIHRVSGFASVPIRPQAPGITGADGEDGSFVVAFGLALQGVPLTVVADNRHAAH